MENILAQLNTGELEIKLTDEKLYFKTLTSQEAFALRGVQGIGVIDLVDDFNKALNIKKARLAERKIGIGSMIIGVVGGLFLATFSVTVGLILGGVFLVLGIINYQNSKKYVEPRLMSSVQIMMSGGLRNFTFDKEQSNSIEVAEFIARVESTLSAYYKN